MYSPRKQRFIEVEIEHYLWIKLNDFKAVQHIPGVKQAKKAGYFLFIFQIGWDMVFLEKGPWPGEVEDWLSSGGFVFT